LSDDMFGNVRRDGEPDSYRTAGGKIDSSVYPDHMAMQVECRATRVSAVDWAADLQEVDIWAFVNGAPERRDDPRRQCAAEPKRVTDRDVPVTDFAVVAVGLYYLGKLLSFVDLKNK